MSKRKLACTLLVLSSLLSSCTSSNNTSNNNSISQEEAYVVRFLANIPKVNVALSSSYVATGSNVLYESASVKENELVSKPDTDPVRVGYDFAGWCIDEDCNIEYNFETPVTSNVNLYAKWVRSANAVDEEYVEPDLKFKEVIDDSVETIAINGVLNSPVTNNSVSLTTIGIRKLTENASNVKELLNYKINKNSTIKSATYENNKIHIEYDDTSLNIVVNDKTTALAVNNTTYENKALKYEANSDIEPYGVVLGGSSSMENWSTSKQDLEPLTTVNVGIGGTTVNQWDECLAERLIYPFNPRSVVLYVGINNIINAGNDGEETGNALVSLFDNIHSHLPDAQIYYVLMNLVPDYMRYQKSIEKGNDIALAYGEGKDYMKYIDAGSLLLKESGKPNRAYFLSDGLHMSLYGYIVWGQQVKKSIIEGEKEKYGN